MASISSSNTFSVANHSSKGMSGLVSGLDTDGMVQQMLSGTQAKIDKQEALKQQLTWKQEIYRELIGNINSFSDKFFGYDSSTNFSSTNFFDMMVATSKSSAFKVTGTPSAATGATSVIVKQLAANAKAESGNEVSSQKLTGEFSADAFTKRKVILEMDGGEIVLDLSNADTGGNADGSKDGKISKNELLDFLNGSGSPLNGAGITAAINENGSLTLTGRPGKEIRVSGKSDTYGLSILGLSAYGKAAVKKDGNGIETARVLTGTFTEDPEIKFQVALDGVSSYITLDTNKVRAAVDPANPNHNSADPWKDVVRDINTQLMNAYGTLNDGKQMLRIDQNGTNGFSLVAEGGGHQIQVAGEGLAMAVTGMVSNQSSRISTSVAMKDVNFGTGLQGDEFKFTINDKKFSFSKNDTLYSVMRQINNSGAGVRVTYSSLTDKFSIEATSAGSGDKIRITQEQGNLLSAMFGADNIAAGNQTASAMGGTGAVKGTTGTSFPSDFGGGTFSMKVNGKAVNFNFPDLKEGEYYTKTEVVKQINQALQQQFGYVGNGNAQDKEQAIELVYSDSDQAFEIKVRNGAAVTFGTPDPDSDTSKDIGSLMGLSGKDNLVKDVNDIPDAGLKALAGTVPAVVTLQKDADGKFTGRYELNKEELIKLADGSSLTVLQAQAVKDTFGIDLLDTAGTAIDTNKVDALRKDTGFVADTTFVKKGCNAVVEINGIETERTSNNFTVNGLSFELKTVTDGYAGAKRLWAYSDGTSTFLTTDVVFDETDQKYYATAADGTKYAAASTERWEDSSGNEITKGSFAEAVTTERDTEKIFEGLKSFVEEYNKLVEKLNTYVYQDPNYKSYAPLTSAQKKEMTDREIEQWEDKSKEGLLRNDSDVSMLLSGMRLAMYQKPDDAPYALYDLGIETGSAFSDKKDTGKLYLDETKLKQMLASDPEAIRQLFTDSEDGLAAKLKKSIDTAAKLSSGSAGALVKLAGMSGYATDKNNSITNQITEIKGKIKDLNRKYEKERQKYWNQFNQMEQLIQQMNSQSSWIGQQFSGM